MSVICFILFCFAITLFQYFLDSYICIFVYFIFFLFLFMFRYVPECSGMFRNVPECSMFRLLSTAVAAKWWSQVFRCFAFSCWWVVTSDVLFGLGLRASFTVCNLQSGACCKGSVFFLISVAEKLNSRRNIGSYSSSVLCCSVPISSLFVNFSNGILVMVRNVLEKRLSLSNLQQTLWNMEWLKFHKNHLKKSWKSFHG